MKRLMIMLIMVICLTGSTFRTSYIDPTGEYVLVNKTTKKNGDIYGYNGGMQVKKITTTLIAMSFGVNRGAPSYNLGAFVDTLKYVNNRAVYTIPEEDSSCRITFAFDAKGVNVVQYAADPNSACGFGHAVAADGYYKRISRNVPVLVDQATGEKIK